MRSKSEILEYVLGWYSVGLLFTASVLGILWWADYLRAMAG